MSSDTVGAKRITWCPLPHAASAKLDEFLLLQETDPTQNLYNGMISNLGKVRALRFLAVHVPAVLFSM